MKVFVWNKVLKDYSYGMIVIHAEDLGHARDQIRRSMKIKGEGIHYHEALEQQPDIIIEFEGMTSCWGGA